MKPTAKQIKSEITALKKFKPLIPRRTLFGDDNHEKIDIGIEVLSKGLTEDDCRRFLDAELDEEGEPTEACFENERCARHAAEWAAGDREDPPSSDWQTLADAMKGSK